VLEEQRRQFARERNDKERQLKVKLLPHATATPRRSSRVYMLRVRTTEGRGVDRLEAEAAGRAPGRNGSARYRHRAGQGRS
jgi:hypothetical protein